MAPTENDISVRRERERDLARPRPLTTPSGTSRRFVREPHRGDRRPAGERPFDPNSVIDFRGVSKRYDSGDIGLERATFAVRPPGVRVPRRLHRLGQVHRDATAHQGVRGDRGPDPCGREGPLGDHAQEDPLLPTQHRCRLPGLQAPAQPHGARQRRVRAAGDRREPPSDPQHRARHPAPHGSVDEAAQLSGPAVGRRAAARRRRARVRQPSAAAARRRADRQPRPRHLDRDHAAALSDQPGRHDRARRDARLRHGQQDAPPRDRAQARTDRA